MVNATEKLKIMKLENMLTIQMALYMECLGIRKMAIILDSKMENR